METAHTFCYNVGRSQNIASATVVTLPKSTMNCPDSSNWDKLNAFCMYVAQRQQCKDNDFYLFANDYKKITKSYALCANLAI